MASPYDALLEPASSASPYDALLTRSLGSPYDALLDNPSAGGATEPSNIASGSDGSVIEAPTAASSDDQTEADYRLSRDELKAKYPDLTDAQISSKRAEIQAAYDKLDLSATQPLLSLPKPEGDQWAGLRRAEGAIEGLTTRDNVMLTAGLPFLPDEVGAGIGAYFAGHMIKGAGDAIAPTANALAKGDLTAAGEGLVDIGTNALMATGIGAHEAGRGGITPEIKAARIDAVKPLLDVGLEKTAVIAADNPGIVDALKTIDSARYGSVEPAQDLQKPPSGETGATPASTLPPETSGAGVAGPTVTETPISSEHISPPEGSTGHYRVQSGGATARVVEYPDRLKLDDLVSISEGQGDGTAVLDSLKAKGKPIELFVGQGSGYSDPSALKAWYAKRGFEPMDASGDRLRWEPPKEEESIPSLPTSADTLAPATVVEPANIPTLKSGQEQGDLLGGGSEDLTLVGEKQKASAPKVESSPEPTVEETVRDAVSTYGSVANAHEHLQTQIDHSDTAPKTKTRLRAAQRFLENLMTDEGRRSNKADADAEMSNRHELLQSVDELGGLPSKSSKHYASASGELQRVYESHKAALLRFGRKDARSLDDLRSMLNGRGFNFDDQYQMLSAIEESMASGRKQFGTHDTGGMSEGPGAGGIGEVPTSGAPSSIKNADVYAQAARDGNEMPVKQARITNPQALAEAEHRAETDPASGSRLIDDILRGKKESVTHVEDAEMLIEMVRVKNARDLEAVRSGDPNLSPTEQAAARDEWQKQQDRLSQIYQAVDTIGTASGRSLQARKMFINDDFTYAGQERLEMKSKGRALTLEEAAELKAKTDRIAELEKQKGQLLDVLDQAQVEIDRGRAWEAMVKDLQDREAARPKYGKEVFDAAHRIVDRWKKEADEARAEWRKEFGHASAVPIPTKAVVFVAKMIRAKVGEFALDFTETKTALIAELGPEIEAYFQKAWDRAKQMMASEGMPPKVREKVKAGVSKPTNGEKTTVDVGARAKAEASAGMELTRRTAYEAVRAVVNSGVKGEAESMAAALELLKPAYSELTPHELDVKFTDYGNAKYPSQEATKVQLAKLHRLRQMQAAINDVKARGETAKSGVQRAKADADVRARQAELKAAIEEYGKNTPPTPEQLVTREQARITAKKNAIEDLDRELKTGEAKVKLAKAEQSPQVKQLQAELDAMRQLKKELEDASKPEKSSAEIAQEEAQKGVDRAAAALDRQRRINSGEITPAAAEKYQPLSPLEKELRDQTEALREAKRKSEAKSEAQKQVEALSKIRDRLDETLSGKRPANAPKDWTPLSGQAETIQAEILAMRELAAQLKRDAKPPTDPNAAAEKAQIRTLEDAIDRYEQKTAAGDFSPTGKRHGPPTEKVAALQAIRDARRDAYDAAKKASRPVKTPTEIYNETRMKAVEKQLADVNDRIASKNYLPKPKPIPKQKFADVAAKEAELADARRKLDEDRKAYERENRSKPQQAIDAVKDTAHLITAIKIIGHGTVGMITHAGGLIWRPTQAAIYWRNFGRQWPMWLNKSYHEQLIYKLKTDPQFEMWKRAGASIDPEQTYTDYGMYAKWLGAVGKNGARGFDALKLTRLELNKSAWENVSLSIKADPVAALETQKQIAAMNNKATGAITKGDTDALNTLARTGPAEALLFAPKLYASRWTRVVLDPVKTLKTFVDWKSASDAEKYAATQKVKNAGEFAATYFAALVVNQGILAATGSGQNVNFSDPKKGDWLKFKAGGKEIVADGGLLDPVRLLGQLVWGDLLSARTKNEQYRDGTRFQKVTEDLGKYLRGKFNPTLGLVVDSVTGGDYAGRPLPFSNEPPRYKDQPKYKWGEWLAEQGPIPISGGVKVAYDEMRKKGLSEAQVKDVIQGAAVSVIGTSGVHLSDEYPKKK